MLIDVITSCCSRAVGAGTAFPLLAYVLDATLAHKQATTSLPLSKALVCFYSIIKLNTHCVELWFNIKMSIGL